MPPSHHGSQFQWNACLRREINDMKTARRSLERFRSFPFWSQAPITLASVGVLVAIWTACGAGGPTLKAPPPPPLTAPRLELRSHYGVVFALAFGPTGEWLASGTDDKMARLWDVSKGTVIRTMRGHGGIITSLAVSPDGRTLATGSSDKTIKLWDTSNGKEERTLAGHNEGITSVAFSPDGRSLASASEDRTIRLWDSSSGEQLRVLEGHSGKVNAIAFSPDRRLLASASDDKTVRLWDLENGKPARILSGNDAHMISLAFSPNGKLLATGSAFQFGFAGSQWGEIKLWDPATGYVEQTLQREAGKTRCLAFSPDGRVLASATDVQNGEVAEIAQWDVKARTLLSKWKDRK